MALLAFFFLVPDSASAYKRSGRNLPEIPATIEAFVASLPPDLNTESIREALEDSGENWPELAAFLEAVSRMVEGRSRADQLRDVGFWLEDAVWLLTNAPHLDRLELTYEQLFTTMIYGGTAVRVYGWEPRSEHWRRYVLNYRFDEEPVSAWHSAFRADFSPTGYGIHSFRTADVLWIAEKAASGFTVLERGYFGNLSDPVSLLQSRSGTERERAILVGAALRSQGYATRFVREGRSGKSWLEVYEGDPREYDHQAWMPVYPDAPERSGDVGYATELCGRRICVVTAGDAFGREQVTGRYIPQGYVRPQFSRTSASGEAITDSEFSGWAITAWNPESGTYVALDDLDYPSAEKDYPLSALGYETGEGVYALGPGEYRLEWGVRYPGGVTHVQTHPFSLQHAEQLTLTLSLDPPAELPLAAMVEREVNWENLQSVGPLSADAPPWLGVLQPKGRYVFLYRDDSEPSRRAAELLAPLRSRSSVFYQELRQDSADEAQMRFVDEVLQIESDDPLPVALVVVDGQTRLYLRGYNLNIAQWIDRALEGE